MQIPIQIVFRGVRRSDAMEAEIRRCAMKLEKFSDDITRCTVTIERTAKPHSAIPYEIRVDIRVPGEEIVIHHQNQGQDLYPAVRDACEAAARRLEDHAHRRRGNVKTHEPRRPHDAEPT